MNVDTCFKCRKDLPAGRRFEGRQLVCSGCYESVGRTPWRTDSSKPKADPKTFLARQPTPSPIGGHWQKQLTRGISLEKLALLRSSVLDPAVDARTTVEDTRTSRRLMRITHGGRAPRRKKPVLADRSPRFLWAVDKAAATRVSALAAKRRIAKAIAERRAEWGARPDGFPERQWQAWCLSQIEGLSDAEIGQQMGRITKQAVRSLINKATRRGLSISKQADS